MEYPIRITLPLSEEMLAEVDRLVSDDESRLAIIREAIQREIERRKGNKA